LQQNLKLAKGTPPDPFKCYRKDDKGGWVALSFRQDKALWRESHTLTALSTESRFRPAVFDWARSLADESRAHAAGLGPHFSFSAFGLATEIGKAASVTFWRHERLPLPLAYLSDAGLMGRIADAIAYAEQTGRDLREAIWALARAMFQPLDSDNPISRGDDASRLAAQLTRHQLYWPALERPFIEMMTALPDIEPSLREAHIVEWRRRVRRVAPQNLQEITSEFAIGARAFRAVAVAERTLWQRVREGLADGEEI
jgi:hypothetical protein